MIEVWERINDYPLYAVSNLGRVKSLPRYCKNRCSGFISKERLLKPRVTNHGYLRVVLYDGKGSNKSIAIHRLVATAFINNENNLPIVMHLDNNKKNNCVNNLKWGTYKENTIQAERDGLMVHTGHMKGKTGSKNPVSKRVCMFDKNGNYLRTFECVRSANLFLGKNADSSNISTCINKPSKKGKSRTAYGYKWRFENGY